MLSQEIAYALSVRMGRRAGTTNRPTSREVLLEQRPESASVMPGLWELPLLREPAVPDSELRMTVRHAIMQVNYYVRVRTVFEDDVKAMTITAGKRRWVPLRKTAAMALTGLARKVLTRAHLLQIAPLDAIAPRSGEDLV
jgi:A/G-specific adenine glycosylase